MREHDWDPPSVHPVDGTRGNIWLCRRCRAIITWNGYPASPITDPHYEVPRPPTLNSSGTGYNRFSPVLDGQMRDCDLEVVRKIMES